MGLTPVLQGLTLDLLNWLGTIFHSAGARIANLISWALITRYFINFCGILDGLKLFKKTYVPLCKAASAYFTSEQMLISTSVSVAYIRAAHFGAHVT